MTRAEAVLALIAAEDQLTTAEVAFKAAIAAIIAAPSPDSGMSLPAPK